MLWWPFDVFQASKDFEVISSHLYPAPNVQIKMTVSQPQFRVVFFSPFFFFFFPPTKVQDVFSFLWTLVTKIGKIKTYFIKSHFYITNVIVT